MISKSTLRRDWAEAWEKCLYEGRCRCCKSTEGIQAAHTIGRARQDVAITGPRGGKYLLVKADAIVPLCGSCHWKYDAHELDLLPYLFLPEQVYAVETAGGIASANKRLSGPNG
jgi:hypothetical protein